MCCIFLNICLQNILLINNEMLVFVTNFFLNPTIVRSYMAASEMT